MAGGNNRSFLRDPLDFLRKHQLIVSPQGYGSAGLQAGMMELDLVPVDPQNSWVVRIENYATRPHAFGSRPVVAWFLPARADAISTLEIDSRCDYVFTADLSGCLFAVYGDEASGPVTVMHANARLGTNAYMQSLVKSISAANHPFCKILSPHSVINPGRADLKIYPASVNTCVVGDRRGGIWRFYFRMPNGTGSLTEAIVDEL
jgi:hypothetical protein